MAEQIEPLVEGQSGLVENVAGKNISFEMGIAKVVSAQGNVHISESLIYRADSGEKMEVRNVAAAVLAAGRDMTVKNVLGNVLVAGGDMHVHRGSVRIAVVGNNFHASRSIIGLAISNQGAITGDNNRILLDKQGAIFFGAAFGAVFGLVSWLLWRKR